MKTTYYAHFSFYSEEYGNFDDMAINVEAADIFEAREQAWLLCKSNEDMKFSSNLKLCGITWDASPLNVQEYFNSQAAYEKLQIKRIENVKIPNNKLDNDLSSISGCEREIALSIGSRDTIVSIAKDFGKGYAMIPPHIFEELHYTNLFISKLYRENKYDQADALSNIVIKAEKWDASSMYCILNLFKDKYIFLANELIRFRDEFGQNGIFPEYADVYERDERYINRWREAKYRDKLSTLPVFSENDVIHKSHTMPFVDYILVIKQEKLIEKCRNAYNTLWSQEYGLDPNFETAPDTWIRVRNMITKEVYRFKREDFHGVLRPEIANNIDFIAIQEEYQKLHPSNENISEKESLGTVITNESDWEEDLEQ